MSQTNHRVVQRAYPQAPMYVVQQQITETLWEDKVDMVFAGADALAHAKKWCDALNTPDVVVYP